MEDVASARAEFYEQMSWERHKRARVRFDLINKSPRAEEETHHEDSDDEDDDEQVETPPISRSNDFSNQIQK